MEKNRNQALPEYQSFPSSFSAVKIGLFGSTFKEVYIHLSNNIFSKAALPVVMLQLPRILHYSLCPELPALVEVVPCPAKPALYHWPGTKSTGHAASPKTNIT